MIPQPSWAATQEEWDAVNEIVESFMEEMEKQGRDYECNWSRQTRECFWKEGPFIEHEPTGQCSLTISSDRGPMRTRVYVDNWNRESVQRVIEMGVDGLIAHLSPPHKAGKAVAK